MTRQECLDQLADFIASIKQLHPARVAIDGIDTAGKTTLADELVAPLEAYGRPVIRASIDGFHRPLRERYQKGPDSPEGYYEDSFDYTSLQEALLFPLGPNGNRNYCRAVFDMHTNSPILTNIEEAPTNAILLFDGVFLLRPELCNIWDFRIFVHIDFEVALRRAMLRDQSLFGSPEATRARYLQRYFPGQRIYLQTVRPQELADAVITNNVPTHPRLVSHSLI